MDSRKLADWSEIVSSVVVVLTLVFLIVEVRTQTRAIERQAAELRAQNMSEPFLDSDLLIEAHRKVRDRDGRSEIFAAFHDRYGMSFAEAEVWSRHLSKTWLGLQSDFDYGNPAIALGVAEALLAYPDQRAWIEVRLGQPFFNRAFRDQVAGIVARLPPLPAPDPAEESAAEDSVISAAAGG